MTGGAVCNFSNKLNKSASTLLLIIIKPQQGVKNGRFFCFCFIPFRPRDQRPKITYKLRSHFIKKLRLFISLVSVLLLCSYGNTVLKWCLHCPQGVVETTLLTKEGRNEIDCIMRYITITVTTDCHENPFLSLPPTFYYLLSSTKSRWYLQYIIDMRRFRKILTLWTPRPTVREQCRLELCFPNDRYLIGYPLMSIEWALAFEMLTAQFTNIMLSMGDFH